MKDKVSRWLPYILTLLLGMLSFFLSQTFADGKDREKRIEKLETQLAIDTVNVEWIREMLHEIKEDIKFIKNESISKSK